MPGEGAHLARPGSVLVVGGDARQVGALAHVLKPMGIEELTICADGLEALEFLFRTGRYTGRKGADPLLVLVSDETSVVSGRDVATRLRSSRHLSGIPVVFFGRGPGRPDRSWLTIPASSESVAAMLVSVGLLDPGLPDPELMTD